MVATVVGLNVVGWVMLAAALGGHYHISKTQVFGVGTGILAYTLGMRHAFDADHIAAIDNTTRKLVERGQAPAQRRVLLLARALQRGLRAGGAAELRHPGPGRPGQRTAARACSTPPTSSAPRCPAFFLFLIAAFNLVILVGILKVFREMRSGRYDDEELEEQLNKRGLMMRFLGPLARRVDTPWKMYPIGFLFGLGFDTATEVALLVLAGTAVVGGLPFYAILSLPILFAAGHEPVRHDRRLLHELRLRLGVRPPGPQGLLQPHHHRAVGLRGLLRRRDRAARPARPGRAPDGGVLVVHARTSTSTRPGSSSSGCSS